MSRASVRKAIKIYHKIINRLPATYPKASMVVVHKTWEDLEEYYSETDDWEEDSSSPYTFYDSDDGSIHISMLLAKESTKTIASYFLHEIGHLFAYDRYGANDKRWTSERYANRFANRWLNKMKKEGLIK